MNSRRVLFPSKLLLFGEYSVLTGSRALVMPCHPYRGWLDLADNAPPAFKSRARWSNGLLKTLLHHLEELDRTAQLLAPMDFSALRKDLNQGLYFHSNIPEGYGLGSSGAVTAAIYHHYAVPYQDTNRSIPSPKGNNPGLGTIKSQLAQIEGLYHGKSSGTDPLCSYTKTPLLVKDMQHIQSVDIPLEKHLEKGSLFLLDTGAPENTEKLVNIFLENVDSMDAESIQDDLLNEITDQAIDSMLSTNTGRFFDDLKELSCYQWQHFQPMIPQPCHALWKKGLDTDHYSLKLCGSGGGGYIMGFAWDRQLLEKQMKHANTPYVTIIPAENQMCPL